MTSETFSPSTRRIIRVLSVLLGMLLIGYAISDHPFYGGEPGFGMSQGLILAGGVVLVLCVLLPVGLNSLIVTFAAVGLFTLAFAEFAGEYLLSARYRPVYQNDDRLLFKFIPDRYGTMTRLAINGGETVTHRINADGFRGKELAPTGSATRIVVYGDSFIHAFYSPDEETFAVQLNRQLAKKLSRPIEVVNAGVSSYGPDQYLLKMQDELSRLQPDLVIVSIFAGNDYGDLLRNKIFRLSPDGQLEPSSYTLQERFQRLLELNQRESILKRALSSILKSRGVVGDQLVDGIGMGEKNGEFALMNFWLEEAQREYQSNVVDRDPVVRNIFMDHYSADVSLRPNSESAQYKVRLLGAVMKELQGVAAAANVPLVFLFIPHPFDVAETYDDFGRVDAARFPNYDRRNQIRPLEEIAVREGWAYVSLFDAFRERDANELYFHGGDDHWNAEGQRLAAELVAKHLMDHAVLGEGR